MQQAGNALAAALLADWQELNASNWRWDRFDGAATSAKAGGSGPRVLVLVGKGHNGGDALLAATELTQRFNCIEIILFRPAPLESLRPLCRRAWDGLFALSAQTTGLRLRDASAEPPAQLFADAAACAFCLDGLLGMQARPPLRGGEAAVLAAVNAAAGQIGLRAAVDLPSGLGEAGAFRADFTYATGIAKRPVFKADNSFYVGRLRYLDIGFFDNAATVADVLEGVYDADASAQSAGEPARKTASNAGEGVSIAPRVEVLTPAVLNPLHNWRSPFSDKRHYGHLFILGGSAQMPGALLMNVQAALRSGAGLVTAFAPQSVAAAFAAQAPEAMWVPWPETDEGTLALEGQHLLATRLPRADALLMGSGVGRSAETFALMEDIARTCDVPLILDADALQPAVLAAAARHPRHALGATGEIGAGNALCAAKAAGTGNTEAAGAVNAEVAMPTRPVLITPHGGEFMRLCPQAAAPHSLPLPPDKQSTNDEANTAASAAKHVIDWSDIDYADALRAFCREHGVITILKGVQTRVANSERVAYALFGGPVLARGGSGDVLAGLLGGCLVQQPREPYCAAQQAVCWHGLAAQQLAQEQGQVSVTTMELVHRLPDALRSALAGGA